MHPRIDGGNRLRIIMQLSARSEDRVDDRRCDKHRRQKRRHLPHLKAACTPACISIQDECFLFQNQTTVETVIIELFKCLIATT